jgi:hypothetical protein
MPNRPAMFVAAPIIAVPIIAAFLFIGSASKPPTGSTVSDTSSRQESRTSNCGPPADTCPQGIALRLRPLEC